MTSWRELHEAHREARSTSEQEQVQAIRKILNTLVQKGYCSPSAVNRLTTKKSSHKKIWQIVPENDGDKPLWLRQAPGLANAACTLQLLWDQRGKHLHALTVMVEGKRLDDSRWALAVHLDDDSQPGGDQKGSGAVGHATFHCHVGPDLDVLPKVRVPLPALTPAQAVEWVFSQLFPDMEPMPWAKFVTPASQA